MLNDLISLFSYYLEASSTATVAPTMGLLLESGKVDNKKILRWYNNNGAGLFFITSLSAFALSFVST